MMDREQETVDIEFNWKIYEYNFWIEILDPDQHVIPGNLIKLGDSGHLGMFIENINGSKVYRVWSTKELTMIIPLSIFELFDDLVESKHWVC